MPNDQKKKTGRQNYDWGAIKHDYVTDPKASLRKMAAKYGVSLNSIYKKSKADGWFAARKKHQERIVAKAIARTEDKMARELSKEADFLGVMKGHMEKMLRDEDQFRRHLVETKVIDDDGGMIITTEERKYDKYDSKAMKDSMQILQMMESMTRSLFNIQKADALQKAQIDRERLELERERLELEKQKAELNKVEKDAVIRIGGMEEGWAE